jgi:hypothetical protein
MSRFLNLRTLLCWFAALLLAGSVMAAEADIRNPALSATEEGYALSADIIFELNPRLEEAINRGVPLYFVTEFELHRPRWYWFDQAISRRTLTWRLSYHALTRQYRLSSGALHQSFSTLDQALRTLQAIRQWQVIDKGALKIGDTYEASLRFRLDLNQLPRPFQVGAIGNRDWQLSSEWLTWPVVPGTLAVERP